MVTHAIDVEGYSSDQLVARAGEARTIKAQMLAASRRDAEQSGRSAGVPDTPRITDWPLCNYPDLHRWTPASRTMRNDTRLELLSITS